MAEDEALRKSAPVSWTTRPCTPADAETLLGLAQLHDVEEFGAVQADLSDIEQFLNSDAQVWMALDEVPVGFAHVHPNGECDSFVDPSYDRALQPALIEEIIARGRALDLTTLQHWSGPDERLTVPALKPFGFHHANTTWSLRHDLSDLTEAVWPPGVVLTPFDRERDGREVWTLVSDAFRSVGLSRDRPFEEWARLSLTDADVHCARRNGELIGCATHTIHLGVGYVRQLAVAESERGRGLGRALLLHTLRHDLARGLAATTLNVDGRNENARRLYDSVGMVVTQEYSRWDLTL